MEGSAHALAAVLIFVSKSRAPNNPGLNPAALCLPLFLPQPTMLVISLPFAAGQPSSISAIMW